MKIKVSFATIYVSACMNLVGQDGVMVDLKPDSVVYPSKSNTLPYLYNYVQPNSFLNAFACEWNTEISAHRIEVSAAWDGNSNAINQQFVWNLLTNTGFSQSQKEKIRSRLESRNAYEDNTLAGIRYKYFSPKFNGLFAIGYNFRSIRTGYFNKELYELIFFGNAMFENKNVDLSQTFFQNMLYNQFSVGFTKNFSHSNILFTIGINASFLHGLNHQSLLITKGRLFTAPDGEYIDLVYDLRLDQNRGGNRREREKADVGMTGDLLFRLNFNRKFLLTFNINDFGALNWRREPLNYFGGRDSIRFKGIEFTDIINDLNNTNFNNIKLDSILQTLLPARRSDKYQTFMPFTFNLTLTKPFLKEKLLVNAGIQYRPLYRYVLYGFIKTNYFISNQWVTSLTLGYGAYSNFNFGLEAARHWKRAELAFGSNNLIGTIAPFAYTGASAYFRLGINF